MFILLAKNGLVLDAANAWSLAQMFISGIVAIVKFFGDGNRRDGEKCEVKHAIS